MQKSLVLIIIPTTLKNRPIIDELEGLVGNLIQRQVLIVYLLRHGEK